MHHFNEYFSCQIWLFRLLLVITKALFRFSCIWMFSLALKPAEIVLQCAWIQLILEHNFNMSAFFWRIVHELLLRSLTKSARGTSINEQKEIFKLAKNASSPAQCSNKFSIIDSSLRPKLTKSFVFEPIYVQNYQQHSLNTWTIKTIP